MTCVRWANVTSCQWSTRPLRIIQLRKDIALPEDVHKDGGGLQQQQRGAICCLCRVIMAMRMSTALQHAHPDNLVRQGTSASVWCPRAQLRLTCDAFAGKVVARQTILQSSHHPGTQAHICVCSQEVPSYARHVIVSGVGGATPEIAYAPVLLISNTTASEDHRWQRM